MKSTGVTYLLYFFFGGVGAHKFYLGRPAAGGLYICMSLLFWWGVMSLSVLSANAYVLSIVGGGAPPPGLAPSIAMCLFLVAPLPLAYLYDLVTIPAQVHAANMRAAATGQTTSAWESKSRRDDDEGLAAAKAEKADELIAQYLAQRSQPAPQQQTIPAKTASAPTFGKRR
jgi:hypothetical protein